MASPTSRAGTPAVLGQIRNVNTKLDRLIAGQGVTHTKLDEINATLDGVGTTLGEHGGKLDEVNANLEALIAGQREMVSTLREFMSDVAVEVNE